MPGRGVQLALHGLTQLTSAETYAGVRVRGRVDRESAIKVRRIVGSVNALSARTVECINACTARTVGSANACSARTVGSANACSAMTVDSAGRRPPTKCEH